MNTLNASMILENAAQKAPNKFFIKAAKQQLTFGQIDGESKRFANVLVGLGVKSGQNVALLLPNSPTFVICFYGILKSGAVPVPLDINVQPQELAYFLTNSQAVALIALAQYANKIKESIYSVKCLKQLILVNVKKNIESLTHALQLKKLMKLAPNSFQTIPTQLNDPALIVYTSGTTDKPKGVVLTHFNIFFSNYVSRELCRIGPNDIILLVASASNMFGQAMLHCACSAKAQVSMMTKFEPQEFLHALKEDKITFFAGVPRLGQLLLNSALSEKHDLTSLRAVMFGGTPLDPKFAEHFKKRFQVDFIYGYGMTEAMGITYITADMKTPPGSVGKPIWGTSVRIFNGKDENLSQGKTGEIVIRGPQVFKEYFKQPDETSHAFRGGWFHTGDIGKLDKDGNLFLIDRLKDIIKTSGYTVAPSEVEKVLESHPAIAETAVIGIPHRTVNEIVYAFVVLKPEAHVSKKDLFEYSRQHLSSYKRPRQIEFKDCLPRDKSGKILRRELRNP